MLFKILTSLLMLFTSGVYSYYSDRETLNFPYREEPRHRAHYDIERYRREIFSSIRSNLIQLRRPYYGYGPAYPGSWPKSCTEGTRQSPIDLRKADIANFKANVKYGNYDVSGPVHIENNGHTISVSGFESWEKLRPYISHNIDGIMKTYRLLNFQFHWGPRDLSGSEHTFAGFHMPMEIQFVHEKNREPAERRGDDDFLILGVLGTTIVEDNSRVSSLASIPKTLLRLRSPGLLSWNENPTGAKTRLRIGSLSDMVPDDTDSFYYYNGSRTVPNCDENTAWMVLDNALYLSRNHLTMFRSVHLASPDVGYNYRPTQPLNDRKLMKFVS